LTEPNDRLKEALLNILGRFSFVVNTKEAKPGEFHSSFLGNKNEASALLAELVRQNIPVAQFFIKEANVEDIFFKIGAREVS
jgi:hypothetical protein